MKPAPAGGEESPDAMNIGSGTLRLRSERSGNGDGRVYLIRVTATDGSSNTSRACLSVVVPKSHSGANVSSVNLQALAATEEPPVGCDRDISEIVERLAEHRTALLFHSHNPHRLVADLY